MTDTSDCDHINYNSCDDNEDGFKPLKIFKSLLHFKLSISNYPLLWKMNLCAYCQDTDTFYLAIKNKIIAWNPPMSNIFIGQNDNNSSESDARCIPICQPLYTWIIDDHSHEVNIESIPDEETEINAIRLCRIGSSPVIVAVTNHGHINVWSTKLPFQPPMHIQNNQESNWGIALASQTQLLAISANNYTISLYKIGFHLAFHECIHVEQNCSGHEHNIPTLDFNSTENYLASGSIDGSIRIWSIAPYFPYAQLVYTRSFKDISPWIWSVRCMNPFFIDRLQFSDLVHYFSSNIIPEIDSNGTRDLDLINLHHLLWNKTTAFKEENIQEDHNDHDIKDVIFCSTSHGICIPTLQILKHPLWFFSHQMGLFSFPHDIDRLNMTCWIPELSIMIIGSQFGYAIITRILNLKECYDDISITSESIHTNHQEYFIVIEDILPRQMDHPRNLFTRIDILSGIFYKSISSSSCLLYLVYQNGSIHMFKLMKNQNSEQIFVHQL